MRVLWLTHAQAQAMVAHCVAEKPREACGLIVGAANGQALRVIPVENVAAAPHHYYDMSPIDLCRELPKLADEGLELIGFYHSHPFGDALPSDYDIRHASYHDVCYVIIGLQHATPKISAWRYTDAGRVEAVPVHLSAASPSDYVVTGDEPLSSSQRAAIMLAGVLAFVMFIALALSLLPPAPIIPR